MGLTNKGEYAGKSSTQTYLFSGDVMSWSFPGTNVDLSLPQLLLRFKVHGWDNDVRGLAVKKSWFWSHNLRTSWKITGYTTQRKKWGKKKQVESHLKKVYQKRHMNNEHMFQMYRLVLKKHLHIFSTFFPCPEVISNHLQKFCTAKTNPATGHLIRTEVSWR